MKPTKQDKLLKRGKADEVDRAEYERRISAEYGEVYRAVMKKRRKNEQAKSR